MPYGDEVMGQAAMEGMAETDAQLFGRKTYEKMASYWPTAPADDPFAQHLNSVQKYVVSTTLKKVEWQPTTIIDGDVAEQIGKLKEQPGKNIGVLGSGELVQTLMANDLVDEYSLTVYPIVLGSGKKLFRDADQTRKLKLVDSKPTTTGGIMLTYRPEP
jgi:dihydrofolate reductase